MPVLQDRLTKEMRFEEITTIEQANIFLETYLPCFNEHFARPSLAKEDLHRPLSKALFLDEVFYIKESCSIVSLVRHK
jgi:hypothetical protein